LNNCHQSITLGTSFVRRATTPPDYQPGNHCWAREGETALPWTRSWRQRVPAKPLTEVERALVSPLFGSSSSRCFGSDDPHWRPSWIRGRQMPNRLARRVRSPLFPRKEDLRALAGAVDRRLSKAISFLNRLRRQTADHWLSSPHSCAWSRNRRWDERSFAD